MQIVVEVSQTFIENRNLMAPAEYFILSLSDRRNSRLLYRFYLDKVILLH